jgi:hypothetical protein
MTADPSPTESQRSSPALYYAILFLVSLAMLSAQVTVTRLLSYKLFFHFVFLLISLAHLGIAGAATWIFANGWSTFSPAFFRRALYLMAVSLILFLGVYVWFAPEPSEGLMKIDGMKALPYLGSLSVLLIAFYFSAGCVLAGAFTQYKAQFNRLYAADLAGASLGCAVSLGMMALLGPVHTLLLSGFLSVVAAALIAVPRQRASQKAVDATLLLAAGAVLIAAWFGTPWLERRVTLGRDFEGKPLPTDNEYRWTQLARVDRVAPSFYVIDGDAGTRIDNPEWVSEVEFLVGRPKPRVAIIGVGAGPQLKEALAHQPESVFAIDINPSIVDWSRNRDRETNGDIFNRPEVTVVIDEGRHAIRSHEGEFDVIDMHAIDTYTASSMGAYSLTENYLYTVEAFEDAYSKLSPNGVMAIRRWLFYPPRENLRLFTTIYTALEHSGVKHPEEHLVVLAPTKNWRDPKQRIMGFMLFSKAPLDAERLAVIDRFVEANGWSWLYGPGKKVDSAFTQWVDSTDRAAFYRGYPYFVEPCYDANPFFFQFTPPFAFLWRGVGADGTLVYNQSTTMLFVTLFALVVLCGIMLVWPIYRYQVKSGLARPSLVLTLYFALLGFGFMAVELSSIQVMTLFLGHPTYALTVILLGILAFACLGSALARFIPRSVGPVVLLLLAAISVAAAFGIIPLVHSLIGASFAVRVGITLFLLMLAGLPMGAPMALGIREIGDKSSLHVAWAWACNGAAGVLGTNICMIVMIYLGMSALFWIGAACYLVACLLLPRIGKTSAIA